MFIHAEPNIDLAEAIAARDDVPGLRIADTMIFARNETGGSLEGSYRDVRTSCSGFAEREEFLSAFGIEEQSLAEAIGRTDQYKGLQISLPVPRNPIPELRVVTGSARYIVRRSPDLYTIAQTVSHDPRKPDSYPRHWNAASSYAAVHRLIGSIVLLTRPMERRASASDQLTPMTLFRIIMTDNGFIQQENIISTF